MYCHCTSVAPDVTHNILVLSKCSEKNLIHDICKNITLCSLCYKISVNLVLLKFFELNFTFLSWQSNIICNERIHETLIKWRDVIEKIYSAYCVLYINWAIELWSDSY